MDQLFPSSLTKQNNLKNALTRVEFTDTTKQVDEPTYLDYHPP